MIDCGVCVVVVLALVFCQMCEFICKMSKTLLVQSSAGLWVYLSNFQLKKYSHLCCRSTLTWLLCSVCVLCYFCLVSSFPSHKRSFIILRRTAIWSYVHITLVTGVQATTSNENSYVNSPKCTFQASKLWTKHDTRLSFDQLKTHIWLGRMDGVPF